MTALPQKRVKEEESYTVLYMRGRRILCVGDEGKCLFVCLCGAMRLVSSS